VTEQGGVCLSLDTGVTRAIEILSTVRTNGRKVIGNGGSAAIAIHMHNDLCKVVGMRALTFTDPSLLTALSNDCEYRTIYEFPLNLWTEPGDLLIVIIRSGRSENILRAAAASTARGCHIVTFSGFDPDNDLRQMGTVNFYVPSNTYGFVEVAHQALGYYLTDATGGANVEASNG